MNLLRIGLGEREEAFGDGKGRKECAESSFYT
jgi:hypothetical protein